MFTNQHLHTRKSPRLDNIRSRADLTRAQRIVVKAGTSTVVDEDGYPSLRRISQIAEDISTLRRAGREVIFVSSGAVGIGRNVVRRQQVLASSAFDRLHRSDSLRVGNNGLAAAGQASLMTLYQTLFSQLDITVSELLLTKHDFETDDRKENLSDALETLMLHGIVPIVNENDAVTANSKREGNPFTDNDGLAALVASQLNADLLILLTDVEGLYDRPPTEPAARLIETFPKGDLTLQFGPKSSVGRGGMQAKIEAATRAIDWGVPAVVVTSSKMPGSIRQVLEGKQIGTLFVEDPDTVIELARRDDVRPAVEKQAVAARAGSRALIALSSQERAEVLRAVAASLDEYRAEILAANQADIERERLKNLNPQLMKRLQLTTDKLDTLIAGIRSIADSEEPIGKILSRMELSPGVLLQKETVPIGVLLVIFESRPDCLPQIAALSLRSGNGLLVKGGREAEKSNEILHRIITEAVVRTTGGRVPAGCIGLITSRAEIGALLSLDKHIDLVIPRGSNAMVRQIQDNTNIPVLGHADGVCHAYVHPSADMAHALKVLIDAKTSYPAACNAVETILIDSRMPADECHALVGGLRQAGCIILGGKRAVAMGLTDVLANDFHAEYSDNRVTVELIDGVKEACAHINMHGSHHTETILAADDHEDVKYFIRQIDSACVFHNASTRMADGYRLGLGAEVGISTARIHARGPVGVEGLLSQKWVLRSLGGAVATATAYAKGESTFTHKELPV
jgi:delta-1-pyrroline-5-carboxylate synthetase